jgi:hypothetical protein
VKRVPACEPDISVSNLVSVIKKAIIAVAAAMLRAAYHMLKDGTFYQELSPDYRRPKNPQRAANNLAKRIRALGFEVELKIAA